MRPPPQPELLTFKRRLGLGRLEMDDLVWALTHRSFVFEGNAPGNGPAAPGDNERLEFLGDAVLGSIAAEALFKARPAASEGELSKLRAQIVSRANLGERAAELGFGAVMRLGKGERATGGAVRRSILGSALEALIGIIYLRFGYASARRFVEKHLLANLLQRAAGLPTDFKSALQEWAQGKFHVVPNYSTVEVAGPDHDRVFTVEVEIRGEVIARGRGSNLKLAQSAAARQGLLSLGLLASEE